MVLHRLRGFGVAPASPALPRGGRETQVRSRSCRVPVLAVPKGETRPRRQVGIPASVANRCGAASKLHHAAKPLYVSLYVVTPVISVTGIIISRFASEKSLIAHPEHGFPS